MRRFLPLPEGTVFEDLPCLGPRVWNSDQGGKARVCRGSGSCLGAYPDTSIHQLCDLEPSVFSFVKRVVEAALLIKVSCEEGGN